MVIEGRNGAYRTLNRVPEMSECRPTYYHYSNAKPLLAKTRGVFLCIGLVVILL